MPVIGAALVTVMEALFLAGMPSVPHELHLFEEEYVTALRHEIATEEALARLVKGSNRVGWRPVYVHRRSMPQRQS